MTENEIVRLEGVTQSYHHSKVALNGVSVTLDRGRVYGLLGRNGAGKTTLLRLIAGLEAPTSGSVQIFGRDPLESQEALDRTATVREDQRWPGGYSLDRAMKDAERFFPSWDGRRAQELAGRFHVPLNTPVARMSRGQRSAAGIVLGLAAGSELLLLDEPYAGLDTTAREIFHDELLASLQDDRTVVFSTHLVDEAAPLLDRVLLLVDGRLVIDDDADVLRGSAHSVSGPRDAVERATAGLPALRSSLLGGHLNRTVRGAPSPEWLSGVRAAGLTVEGVSLQRLVTLLSETEEEVVR